MECRLMISYSILFHGIQRPRVRGGRSDSKSDIVLSVMFSSFLSTYAIQSTMIDFDFRLSFIQLGRVRPYL